MASVELRVISGSQTGAAIPLSEGKFLIGREHDCHLRPNSELVSRHHCAFTRDSYSLRLRDLGSTNGTYVNGERVNGTIQLKAGDRISIGKLDLVVVIDGQPGAVTDDTLHAQKDDTVFTGRRSRGAPEAGDSGFDVSTLSSELEALEDETVTAPAAPAAAEVVPVSATVVAAPPALPDPAQMPGMAPAIPGYPPNPWMAAPPYPYPPAYPQYPGMPYGYGYPYPGMPQMPPGYGYPPQQPAIPAPEAPAEQPAEAEPFPEFRLPDPATTGAKAPPPPAPAKPEEAGKPKAHIPTAAQDIINNYMNRRPKT
jgi:pSer/pThr/pTyr-binding forkhead associated (FHA) protein